MTQPHNATSVDEFLRLGGRIHRVTKAERDASIAASVGELATSWKRHEYRSHERTGHRVRAMAWMRAWAAQERDPVRLAQLCSEALDNNAPPLWWLEDAAARLLDEVTP